MLKLKNIIENEGTFEFDNVVLSSTTPYTCERYSMHYSKLKEISPRMVACAVDEALTWVDYDSRDVPFNPFNIEAWAYMYAWAWNQELFKTKLEGFKPNANECWLSAMKLAEREWEGTEKLFPEDILDKMMDWWNLFHKSESEE